MKHKNRYTNKLRKKFTLIELLVVVSIIAILFSLLLPSLTKAKQLAARINCTNNMKQMHLAILSYSETYKGWMPITRYTSVYDGTSVYPVGWLHLIHPYINGKVFDDGKANTAKGTIYCPAGSSEIYESVAEKPMTNYMYSAFLGLMSYASTSISYKPRRLDRCDKPAIRAIMIDGKNKTRNANHYDFNDIASAENYVSLRHPGGTNVIFADGHVGQDKVLTLTTTQISDRYKWVFYWPY